MSVALLLALALLGDGVHADFVTALQAYQAKDFAKARAEFLTLAELGDGASQYNLAAMALHGDGELKNIGEGVGWLLAAQQNGHDPNPEVVVKMQAELSAEQKEAAQTIVARYGREAMQADVLPRATISPCVDLELPKVASLRKPKYPMGGRQASHAGAVVVGVTVGIDGLPYDPEIVAALPEGVFDDPVIDSILGARFQPARHFGNVVASTTLMAYGFALGAGGNSSAWDPGTLAKLEEWAAGGHPQAQFLLGVAAWSDKKVGIERDAAWKLIVRAGQGGDANAQYWIARYILTNGACESSHKARPWLDHAAAAGQPAARVMLANNLMADGADAAELNRIRDLLRGIESTNNAFALKHAIALVTTGPLAELRDPLLARSLANRLEKVSKSHDPQRDEAIAAACALESDFGCAVKRQRQAIKQATALKWNTSLMEVRLASYQREQNWVGELLVVPPAIDLPPVRAKSGSTPGSTDD